MKQDNTTINLDIAGIQIGLDLPRWVAQKLDAQYRGFFGGQPELRLQVIPEGRAELQQVTPPQLQTIATGWALNLPGSFDVEVNDRAQTGQIRFPTHPRDPEIVGPPLCLQSALKTMFITLAAQSSVTVLHASGVLIGQNAVLFVGKSGAGKSTTSALFGEDAILNDELLALTHDDGRVWAHATPFSGTLDAPRRRRSAPLRVGFALQKADRVTTRPLSPAQALSTIFACTPLPLGSRELERAVFAQGADLATLVPWQRLDATLDGPSVTQAVRQCVEGLS